MIPTETDKAPRLEGKFVIGTNPLVDNMVKIVAVSFPNLQNSLDEVFDIRRAGPDIDDSADAFSRTEIFVRGAQETILATAINPRSANDITTWTRVEHGALACDLGFSIDVDRPGLVFDRVERAVDGFAIERILRAEVNEFSARPAGRFGQVSRPLDVYGVSFGRILLRLIDLDYCAVDDQGGLSIRNAATNGFSIGNIEIGTLQRHHLVLTSQPLRCVTTDESCGTCNKNLHLFDCRLTQHRHQERCSTISNGEAVCCNPRLSGCLG